MTGKKTSKNKGRPKKLREKKNDTNIRSISPIYYLQLNKELDAEYQHIFKQDPDDLSLKMFTKEQQIERIAHNYLFWSDRKSLSSIFFINFIISLKIFNCFDFSIIEFILFEQIKSLAKL